MKKVFYFIAFGFFILSCSKEKENPTTDRLSFQNMQAFNDTYDMLAKIDSRDGLSSWAISKNHSTMLNSSDSTIEYYSDVLKTILNKDAEFELRDSIIWFNNGILYAFSKGNSSDLSSLKKNISKCHKVGAITLSPIKSSIDSSSGLKLVSITVGGVDARNQFPFRQTYYQPCGGARMVLGGDRKFVHEIYAEAFYMYPNDNFVCSRIHLRIKLEYKGGSGYWKPAGEQREIAVNVTGTANNVPFSFQGSKDCFSGNWDITLKELIDYGRPTSYLVSMSGSIYQRVKGDVTPWTNTGSGPNGAAPLW